MALKGYSTLDAFIKDALKVYVNTNITNVSAHVHTLNRVSSKLLSSKKHFKDWEIKLSISAVMNKKEFSSYLEDLGDFQSVVITPNGENNFLDVTVIFNFKGEA